MVKRGIQKETLMTLHAARQGQQGARQGSRQGQDRGQTGARQGSDKGKTGGKTGGKLGIGQGQPEKDLDVLLEQGQGLQGH